jgi:simple sugar transport system substrate-binding protein
MVAAQERGKMAIGYHTDMSRVAPDAQLLAVTHHWGAYYARRVQAVLDRQWKSTDTWGGVREGMIKVEGFGTRLTPSVRQEVMTRYREMAQGRLIVFKGPIWDASGKIVLAPGQELTDAQILNMNFMVQGVRVTVATPR